MSWIPKEHYGLVPRSRGRDGNRLQQQLPTKQVAAYYPSVSYTLLASAVGSGMGVRQCLTLGMSYSSSEARNLSCSPLSTSVMLPHHGAHHAGSSSSGCEVQGQRLFLIHCQHVIGKLAHGSYSAHSYSLRRGILRKEGSIMVMERVRLSKNRVGQGL